MPVINVWFCMSLEDKIYPCIFVVKANVYVLLKTYHKHLTYHISWNVYAENMFADVEYMSASTS